MKFEKGGPVPSEPGDYCYTIRGPDGTPHTCTVRVERRGRQLVCISGQRPVPVEQMAGYGRWEDSGEPDDEHDREPDHLP